MLHHQFLGDPSGEVIVFLHPGNATGRSWGDIVDKLSGVNALCIDLPGFGDSKHIPFTTFEAAAASVADVIRYVNSDRATHIVGFSLGAYVGLMLNLKFPELVKTTLLTGFQTEPLKGGWWMIPVGDILSPLLVMKWVRMRTFKVMKLQEGSSWKPDGIAPCSAATNRIINREAVNFDAHEYLHEIQNPFLALAGEKEHPTIRKAVKAVADDLPSGEGRFAPGGHTWPCHYPDLFSETVMNFVQNRSLPQTLKMPS